MKHLLPVAASQGYAPDNVVCADDLAAGRPTPLMMYKCFLDLSVWPASAVVKVDDTAPGIAEGLAAGCWTVGVTLSGNAAGLSYDDLNARSEHERAEVRRSAAAELERAGAHYVVDSVADLMSVIDRIEGRLVRGDRP
jgi:phosphonoacetaldehyde hydrolase